MNKAWFRAFIFVFILMNASQVQSAQKPLLWAAHESIKIFKDSSYEPDPSIWDEARKKASLRSAGNETIAFQLVISPGQDLTGLTVRLTDFVSQDGQSKIAKDNAEIFLVWFTCVPGKKCYPDALIPFFDPYSEEQRVVVKGFEVKKGFNQPVWIDIRVPDQAKAGIYTARALVERAGEIISEVNLKLTVFPFSIPDQRHIVAYSEMYPEFFYKKEDLNGAFEKKAWQVLMRYYQMARWHRFDFNLTAGDLETKADQSWEPDGTFHVSLSTWSKYDSFYTPVLTGEIFHDKLPPLVWRLPFPEAKTENLYQINCKYLSNDWQSLKGCYDKTYQYWQTRVSSLASSIESHFLAKEANGLWPSGTLERSFVYYIDEPRQYNYHYQFIKDYSGVIKKAAPGIKIMITEQPEEPLFEAVDIWAPPASTLAPERAKQARQRGEKVWFYQWSEPYIGNASLEADAVSLRMWAWAAFKYDIDGVFLWANNFWSSDNPYTDPQFYEYGEATDSWGNGYIFYPGAMLSKIGFVAIDGPVSSIRMKMWRRGFIDYEYLLLAKNKDKQAAKAIADSVVKSALAVNYRQINNSADCAKKKHDGQKTAFIDGQCVGICSDHTTKSCYYNEGILIGPWDCDDGPDESGKYPQWWEDPRAVKKISGWSKNPADWELARLKLAEIIIR